MKRRFFIVLIFILTVSFPVNAGSGLIKNNRQALKLVALTFDDGPHLTYTDEILDILKKYNIKATFFVVGTNVKYFPDKLKRIAAEGHEIGNHTYSHKFLTRYNDETITEEIKKAEEIILSTTGIKPKVFRPPGGMYNERIGNIAKDLGYISILWSQDPRDWSKTSISTIENKVISNASDGDIILFHDFNQKNSPTPEALRRIIPKLIEMGYRFVTVSDIIAVTIEDKTE